MDNSPSETPSLGSLGTSLSSIRGSKHRSNLFSIDHILSSSVAAAVAANADSNNNNPHNQHHHHLYNPLLAHSDKHLMSNTHNVDTFQQHLLQQHQHQQLLQQLQLQQAHLNRDPERDLTSLNDQLNFFNQQRNQLMAAAAAAAALAPAYQQQQQQQQQPLNPYSSTLDHHQQLLEKIKNSPPLAGTMQPQTASPDFLYLMACMFLQQQQQQQQQQLQQSHPTLRQQSPQRQQQSQHHNHHQPQHSKLKHLNQNVQQQQEATTRQSFDSLASSPMDSLAKLALFANQQQDDLTSSNKPLANKRQSQQSNAKRARPDGSPDVEFDQAQPNLTDFKSSSSSNLMSALNQSAHRSNQPLRPKSSTKQNLNNGNHLKSFVEDTRGNNSSNNNNNTSNDRTHNNNNTISNSNINKSTSDLISSAAQALISGSNLTSATKGTTKVNSTGEALLPTPINTTLAKAPPELIKKQPAWVFCTRYSDRPSSGPRTRKKTKHQHEKKSKDSNKQANQSSFNLNDEKRPRTAFTSEQLDKLRKEFQENSYLDEKRRKDLADRLCLNENQIKIWFQNKRAKMKKQNSQPNPLRGLLVAGGLYNHSTATSDCSESYANGNDMDQDMGDQNHHQRQLSTAGNHASGQEVDDDEEEEEDDNDCMDLNDPLDVI